MDLRTVIRSHGGVMPTRALRDLAGGSRHVIDRAVRRGELARPGNGWIALPEADPLLVAAAGTGVVLTCVTHASRLGLWDVGERTPHVAATPGRALKRSTSAHVHWGNPPVPRDPSALEDPVENVLFYVADCRPYEEGLAIWESAYRRKLVTYDQMSTLPLKPNARRICEEMRPTSDSGHESVVVPRLRGFRVSVQQQVWILGHCVDVLIGDRLVLQIDGGHHVDAQRLEDNRHDAELRLAGYHVIRVGAWQVKTEWNHVHALVAGAIARGLHLAPARAPGSRR